MVLDIKQKEVFKKELVDSLAPDPEVCKIVVFGSFLHSPNPADMDVAVFQDSAEPYIALAMKYRRQTRAISQRIPMDIIPLRSQAHGYPLEHEIESGETVYAR